MSMNKAVAPAQQQTFISGYLEIFVEACLQVCTVRLLESPVLDLQEDG